MKSVFTRVAWVVLVAGCTGVKPTVVVPAPTTLTQAMGYDEAVQLGTQYARQFGYQDAALQDALPVGARLWRVRFGLARKEGVRHLVLELDGATKKLIKSEEETRVAGKFVPISPP